MKKVDLVIWVGTLSCFATQKPLFSDLSVNKFLQDCLGENAQQVGKLVVSNLIPCEEGKNVCFDMIQGWEKTFGIRAINTIKPKVVYDGLVHDDDVQSLRKEIPLYFKSVPIAVRVEDTNKNNDWCLIA